MKKVYIGLFIVLTTLYLSVRGDDFNKPNGAKADGGAVIPPQNSKNPGLNTQGNQSPNKVKLAEDPLCRDDIKRLCSQITLTNNFAVLDCLYNLKPEEIQLNPHCDHLIWTFKKELTEDDRFFEAAKQVCGKELSKFPNCQPGKPSGHMLSCLIDEKDNMTSIQCKQFLTKMESIIFSDYNLIYQFTDKCKVDIDQYKCGRFDNREDMNSQGHTIECLSEISDKISEDCRHAILRVAELQADDYHLDRPLFLACREDRERLCKKVEAGEGRVYRCLMHHKMSKELSATCREKLTLRQKLISQDFKISRGLARSCREFIRQNHCRDEAVHKNKEIRLTKILMCLENALHMGKVIDAECQSEMLDHRRSLMEDYKVNPELVNACGPDIQKFCLDRLEEGGRTLHCLLERAKPTTRKKRKRVSEGCRRELEALVKHADAGEDWRADPILQEACQSVVDLSCKDIRPGEGRVLSCLMDKINSDHMTDECEQHLLQIQYFVARDFRLDPRLFKYCKDDAIKKCHADKDWAGPEPGRIGPEPGPLLPCLFRYAYHPENSMKLERPCIQEVRRVMRQRAVSVDLQPEIAETCIEELTNLCLDKREKGEEMVCLQDNLEELGPECRNTVGNYTEEEGEHIELNSILYKACESVAKKFCPDVVEKDVDQGDLFQCLVEHKNDFDLSTQNPKCRTAIEHFQLISIKDYRFSFKFKEACKTDVMRLCKHVKTKWEVVSCLSETVRNDTLFDKTQRTSKECRHQLRGELLHRNEDILLDPELRSHCKADSERLCKEISPGNSQVIECLKYHRRKLSPNCHRHIFNREKEEMMDNRVDYALMTACKRMIKKFCADADMPNVLSCLKNAKDDLDFDNKCKSVVTKRLVQQSSDYRLNPVLRKACRLDIKKYCNHVLDTLDNNVAFEGRVVGCLKGRFSSHKLSSDCEQEIVKIIHDSQLDYNRDPVLVEVCGEEIKQLCSDVGEQDGKGEVEECLKMKLKRDEIRSEKCREQVAELVKEGRADIHGDPLLYRACIADLKKLCSDVPQGESRQLTCLMDHLQKNPKFLEIHCKEMLSTRIEMFQFAEKIPVPESVQDVIDQVSISPSRNYFLVVLMAFVGVVFFGGLFCGRATKRIRAEVKNK